MMMLLPARQPYAEAVLEFMVHLGRKIEIPLLSERKEVLTY